jgi:hypothetical protein
MRCNPMRLLRIPEPFDDPDFVFEPKLDGFRALAHIKGRRCSVISRNGNVFKSWPQLCEQLAHAVHCKSAVLDGEICCLEPDGRTDFYDLLFRREQPYFYAYDLLMLNGEDLRVLPLTERKRRLAAIMPKVECRALFLDSIVERGRDLFRLACERDLVREADDEMVKGCEYLGDVTASSTFGGLVQGMGQSRARKSAYKRAAQKGATHLVWSRQSSGYGGANASGRAYKCEPKTADK